MGRRHVYFILFFWKISTYGGIKWLRGEKFVNVIKIWWIRRYMNMMLFPFGILKRYTILNSGNILIRKVLNLAFIRYLLRKNILSWKLEFLLPVNVFCCRYYQREYTFFFLATLLIWNVKFILRIYCFQKIILEISCLVNYFNSFALFLNIFFKRNKKYFVVSKQ